MRRNAAQLGLDEEIGLEGSIAWVRAGFQQGLFSLCTRLGYRNQRHMRSLQPLASERGSAGGVNWGYKGENGGSSPDGKGVHLSGGAGIGGVLEPLQASPVIVEDGCFIGSRCIVVEGVIVEKEAVLGANVVLTQSTKIIDVSGSEPKEMKGRIPSRSVVIPGSYMKKFPAGEFGVGCALIIGQRKPSTDLKTSLNDALRDFNVSV